MQSDRENIERRGRHEMSESVTDIGEHYERSDASGIA